MKPENKRVIVITTVCILVYGSVYMTAYFRDTISMEEKQKRRSLIHDLPNIAKWQDGSKAHLYKQLQDNKHQLKQLEMIEYNIQKRLTKINSEA